jgi:hypothetical protein
MPFRQRFRHIGGVADVAIPDTAFGLHRRAVFAPVGGVAEGDFKALCAAGVLPADFIFRYRFMYLIGGVMFQQRIAQERVIEVFTVAIRLGEFAGTSVFLRFASNGDGLEANEQNIIGKARITRFIFAGWPFGNRFVDARRAPLEKRSVLLSACQPALRN